jgi:hypothetical protein
VQELLASSASFSTSRRRPPLFLRCGFPSIGDHEGGAWWRSRLLTGDQRGVLVVMVEAG